MCELFAMSSDAPTDVRFSLEEFSRHGGLTGPHKDGWGIAYYVGRDVKLVKEPLPASDSACVRYIQDRPFTSPLVISHIRKATQGEHVLANCQPFTRELAGRMHVFAHNGDLDPEGLLRLRFGAYRPIGSTDSERAFCILLARLSALWLAAGAIPPIEARLDEIARFAAEIRPLGPANFLYADGDAVFAHAHKRLRQPSGSWQPGLHALCRTCSGGTARLSTAGLSISGSRTEQHVVLVASVPLTDEPGWQALDAGDLVAVRGGMIVARSG
jgi:glutamine amidotransferase